MAELLENNSAAPPAVAQPEQETEAIPAGQAQVSRSPAREQLAEKPTRPEDGPRIPSILLEGDESYPPPTAGPGQKFELGPTSPAARPRREGAALPAAYGTGKLLLAARDPHWLYVHWDLTPEQQRCYNALSADHHLVVRLFAGAVKDRPALEVHVHPESRHWFIHVERAGTRYVAELGYYRTERQWVRVATSAAAVTPPDGVSTDTTVRFATIPVQVRLIQLAKPAGQPVPAEPPPQKAAREHALAELVNAQLTPQAPMSSAEVPELVRGPGEEAAPAAPAGAPPPLGGESGNVSSPMGLPEQAAQEFWLNVNADLIIYGATATDAAVTVGGEPVELRPDGTFSCRLALPDGQHELTVSAVSAKGEWRQAEFDFSRSTEYSEGTGPAPEV